MRRRAKDAGIAHLHPHLFRHTFAHQWLDSGGQENDLRRLADWRTAPTWSPATAGSVLTTPCERWDTSTWRSHVGMSLPADRRAARVVLVRAPKPMCAQLEASEVAHFFKFRRRNNRR